MALVCLCRGNFYWPPHTTILFCSIFLDKIVLDTLKSRYHRSAPLGMATCIREQLSWILDSQLRDTAKASLMLPDGSYCRKHSAVPFDSQDTFMQQSPHIPAAAAGAPKERAIG